MIVLAPTCSCRHCALQCRLPLLCHARRRSQPTRQARPQLRGTLGAASLTPAARLRGRPGEQTRVAAPPHPRYWCAWRRLQSTATRERGRVRVMFSLGYACCVRSLCVWCRPGRGPPSRHVHSHGMNAYLATCPQHITTINQRLLVHICGTSLVIHAPAWTH